MRPNIASRLALAAALGASAAPALAQPYYQNNPPPPPRQDYRGDDRQDYRQGGPPSGYSQGYRDGYRAGYQAGRYRARYNDLPPPPPGPPTPAYSSGGDRDERWRARYGRVYTANDDRFYQECRNQADPAGVLAGALIGGLLGNAAGHGSGRAPATVAGVIVGGVAGGALTQHMQCEDRSYAYKTYSDAFNSGRPRSDWQWDNPDNGNYGDFRVGDYYTDADGFRCATYVQKIWVRGEPEYASGHACQQPDGSWTIVD
jgi:surface antigen